MGRQKKFRNRNRDKDNRRNWDDKREDDGNDPKDNAPRGYTLAMKTNEAFENYYKVQGIVPEGEWDDFLHHLRQPLPSTFRVAGFRAQARELVKYIKGQFFSSLSDLIIDGKTVDPPKCLSWYPGELAWQINPDKSIIKKSEDLKKLHQFLVSETESGNISRQEAVSMLPPLVLDVKPHHKILDMCAAPGSKTAQLIEMLHADESINIPDGFVVANDSDNRRCYLMVHQVKRLESPNFMIINHDAAQLPNLRLSEDDRRQFVTYDRVLCDVPCSGDGTMRKNPDVWSKWNAAGANNLHNLQVRILKRGLELLEVGGRLVYSTCSFNPVEDEAVVGSLLEKCEGTVQLVDVSAQLPGLKYMNGKKSWKVMTRKQEFFDKFENVPKDMHTYIRPSMFPLAEELSDKYNIERCIRVLPHHQNTGGFFVAVLEKTAKLPWAKEKEPAAKSEEKETENMEVEEGANNGQAEGGATAATVAAEGSEQKTEEDSGNAEKRKAPEEEDSWHKKKKPRLHGYKEDPFVWLTEADPVWPPIKEFYGMKEGFTGDMLMVRCAEGKKRNLYFTTKALRTICELNYERVKFINMGLKLFARSDSPHVKCDFRLVNDGINLLYPFIGSRVVEILPEDLVIILSQENPFLYKISEFARNNMEHLDQGGVVYIIKESGKPNTPGCDIVLTGWKGKASCRSFLKRFERSHYLRLFGKELKSKEEIQAEKAARKAAAGETEGGDSDKISDSKDDKDNTVKVETDPIEKGEAKTEATEEANGKEEQDTVQKEVDSVEKEEDSVKKEEDSANKEEDSVKKEEDSEKSEDSVKEEQKVEVDQS